MANNRNNQSAAVGSGEQPQQDITLLINQVAEQADTIAALNASLAARDKELAKQDIIIAEKDMLIASKDDEITSLKEQIDSFVENYMQGGTEVGGTAPGPPPEEIDPERARIIASAQADIEELRAAKRRG